MLTILDTNIEVVAYDIRTRDSGTTSSDITLARNGQLRLNMLPMDCTVSQGDLIYTTGYGGLYPKDLAVGEVTEIHTDSSGMSMYAVIDPLSAEKLETTREKILTLVREMRPRFVAAFERMQFQGHVIRIAVPSEALREEILRNKTELLLRIAETSGVQGMLELDVTINEEIRAARPIKLEDRVKYMTEKNPLLAELRRALDLEVE